MRPRLRIASALLALGFAAGAAASCNNDGSGPLLDCAPSGKVECQTNCTKQYPWSGTQCDSYCVDLQGDTENCGHCGYECPPAEVCVSGRCVTQCGAGNSLCPVDDAGTRRCVNTANDNENCGGCGNPCKPGWLCHDGRCGVTCGGTAQGQTLCPVDGGPPYCANLGADDDNCGKCGNACGPKSVCLAGSCVPLTCDADQTSCGDGGTEYCANLQTDNANCGKCGTKCGVLETCTQGQCASGCNDYQTKCTTDGGAPFCASVFSDNTNCGTCGNVCPSAKPMCAGGVCNDGSCGTTALVLGDGGASSNTAYQTLLQGLGYTVTVLASGSSTYTGTPDASTFGVVIVTPGKTYWLDMPSAGQSSIVSAQAAGTGIVFTEFASFEQLYNDGGYAELTPMLLFPKGTTTFSKLTFTVTSSHPIWTGLPSSFTTTLTLGTNATSGLNAGATQIASCLECAGAGVAVVDPVGGAGRVVHINHAAGYSAWYNDSKLTRMMGNAALWASHCY